MEEEAQKTVALKKAYADVILNTAKEAAARVMVSERKALRFQQDLCATKDEALRMLLRVKQIFDSKTTEAENKSLSQRKRIEELEAQLDEAEETIIDLRAELQKAQDQLDKVKNNHMWSLSGSIEKQGGPCHEGTKYQKLATSSPILSYPTDSGPNVITSELENTSLNPRLMDSKCCNSAKQSASLKSDLENSGADNPNFGSVIMRSKEPELYRNGCTQRVRAFERNLLDGNLPSDGNADDQHFFVKRESITKICSVPPPKTQNIDVMKNPTRLKDMCIKSCTFRDQPFKVCKIQRRKTRYGKAKATSCSFRPRQPSSVLSHCKASSDTGNDNVKPGEGACTLPRGETENKNLMENSSGLEEKVQQNKDEALSVVRRSFRKRKVKNWDAIVTSCRSLPDQLTKPCAVLSRCKTHSVNCIVESVEDQPYSESETKIKTDVDPLSGSTDITPHIMADRASGFTGNSTDKDTGLIDEAVLVEQGGDAAESPRVPNYKSNLTDNKPLLQYTFSRKRKRESLTNPEENTSLGKNSAKKSVAEKQNGGPEPQKSSLIDQSIRDSRRMVQVARQLISLSGKRW